MDFKVFTRASFVASLSSDNKDWATVGTIDKVIKSSDTSGMKVWVTSTWQATPTC